MENEAREYLMTHFVMNAPPPDVPGESLARAGLENLWIQPVKVSYEDILGKLERIGDDWHSRAEHVNGKRERTKSKLEGKRVHCWAFMRGEEEVGFCVAIKGGFDAGLSEKFNLKASDSEIYKIGLYPEFQHSKLGHVYLPMVQVALLSGQAAVPSRDVPEIKPSSKLYLNTRTSNSTDSRGFYQKRGWTLRGEDRWVDPISDHGTHLSPRIIPEPDGDQGNQPVSQRSKKKDDGRLKPIGSGAFVRNFKVA